MSPTLLIKPVEKDLGGGFTVKRLLPAAAKRAVGPFVFLDHMGPAIHGPQSQFDVRAHPHIGLATVTYLFEGAMMHRDSLGHVQRIEPGAINWMTAGRGVVHSERTPDDLRNSTYTINGLQLWAALPAGMEECAPGFEHTPASAIPVWRDKTSQVRVLIGSLLGLISPVSTFSQTLYADIDIESANALTLPSPAQLGNNIELALYGVDGDISLNGIAIPNGQLVVLSRTDDVRLTTRSKARCMLIGGAALPEHRFMWWNFVSTRKERIEQAKEDWRAQRMGSIAGETDFIPLPS